MKNHTRGAQAAVGEAPSVHQPGKWVESASIDGERWVDSSDAVAMDAWGTAAPPAPKAIFDPQKAAQQKMKPQRRTSLTSVLLRLNGNSLLMAMLICSLAWPLLL